MHLSSLRTMSITVAWILDLGCHSEIKTFNPQFLGEPGSKAKENKLPPLESVWDKFVLLLLDAVQGGIWREGDDPDSPIEGSWIRKVSSNSDEMSLIAYASSSLQGAVFSLGITTEFSSRDWTMTNLWVISRCPPFSTLSLHSWAVPRIHQASSILSSISKLGDSPR